jgi:hypothetical protein
LTPQSPHDAAESARLSGISVWPPRQDGTKAPDGEWKIGQSVAADAERLAHWYAEGRTGVGWITGAVSGGLEVLDFDDRSVWSEYQRLCRDAGLEALLERVAAGYLEHSPNGAHLAYRCSEIAGNTKLAKRRVSEREWKSLIETRGEGGFIIVAPSSGSVNARGAYVLQSGAPASIVTITPDERRALFDVARIFDESTAPTETRRAPRADNRPGDDFNARASWEDVLEPHGWVRVFGRLGVTSWRRPGKDKGISATTNYANSDLLYVFSTSTTFDAERGYSKFSAFSLLNHGGDFSAAAHALSLQGYGLEIPQPDPEVDISRILDGGEAKPPALSELMRVPGAIGELADWIEAGAKRAQPVLALAASIAAVSALIGRKVQTESGVRPNLYVLGIGETGCGKERAREAIGKLFEDLGAEAILGDAFASDAAIESAIERRPVRLFLIDEIGYLLGTVRDEGAPSHIKSIVPVLLRMYSASSSSYRKREYASSEADAVTVREPSLSIYGTTVPGNLYANLTKAHITNGLLSRLLVFESTDPYPPLRMVAAPKAPASLTGICKAWAAAPINADPTAGDIERREVPNPLVVCSTAQARQVFDDLEQTMRKRVDAVRSKGGEQGPYTRVVATALKLSLIRACGISNDDPEITESEAQWGAGLAWRLTEDFAARVGDAAPENKTEEAGQRVLKLVRASGGISRQQLIRKTRFLSARQLDDTLKTLMEAGDVVSSVLETSGRPKTVYEVPSA